MADQGDFSDFSFVAALPLSLAAQTAPPGIPPRELDLFGAAKL